MQSATARLPKLEPIREGFNDRLFGSLTRTEQTQLTGLLSKLNDRLALMEDEMESDVA